MLQNFPLQLVLSNDLTIKTTPDIYFEKLKGDELKKFVSFRGLTDRAFHFKLD